MITIHNLEDTKFTTPSPFSLPWNISLARNVAFAIAPRASTPASAFAL